MQVYPQHHHRAASEQLEGHHATRGAVPQHRRNDKLLPSSSFGPRRLAFRRSISLVDATLFLLQNVMPVGDSRPMCYQLLEGLALPAGRVATTAQESAAADWVPCCVGTNGNAPIPSRVRIDEERGRDEAWWACNMRP